jgi:RNA polymerase sigma-70 factor (ECF subfamily)
VCFKKVLPLATDADPVGAMTLPGKIDLFPVRRSEEIEMQFRLHSALDAVSRDVEDTALSDEKLVARLRNEDPEALDLLFGRHSKLVYSIAFRILRDAGEAEEVVQECFLYMFRKAWTFEPSRGSAKVWIVQIAYSRARDRKAHLLRRGFYRSAEIESDSMDSALVSKSDVEREIEAKVDFDRLQCAFTDLTDIQRETLQLFYFEELGLREISERLHEPLGNVRHHFYRGLERLRKSAIAERLRNHRNGES